MNEVELIQRDTLPVADLVRDMRSRKDLFVAVVIAKSKQGFAYLEAIDFLDEPPPVRRTPKLAVRDGLQPGLLLQSDHVANGLILCGSKLIVAYFTVPVLFERIGE